MSDSGDSPAKNHRQLTLVKGMDATTEDNGVIKRHDIELTQGRKMSLREVDPDPGPQFFVGADIGRWWFRRHIISSRCALAGRIAARLAC